MLYWLLEYIFGSNDDKTDKENIPQIPDSNLKHVNLRVGDYNEDLIKIREKLRKSTTITNDITK